MGLIGLLIAALILILIFVFSYLTNSSSLTPEKSKKIQTEAQNAVNSEAEKSKLEQDQIKNIYPR